jgi:cytochrome c-type biogenesis protein CcmE
MVVTVVILVGAFSGLLWATLRDGTEYYKNVNEVMGDRASWEGKPLQLHGYVVPGSVLRGRDASGNPTLEYHFKVQNDPPRKNDAPAVHIVDAVYTGIVPDTFKGEAEVVLKGRLSADKFQTDPNGVMAKCPSKYEAAQQGS